MMQAELCRAFSKDAMRINDEFKLAMNREDFGAARLLKAQNEDVLMLAEAFRGPDWFDREPMEE